MSPTSATALIVRCETGELARSLKTVTPFAKGPRPVNSGVRLTAVDDRLMLEATTGDQRVVTSLPVAAEQHGAVVVPAKLLDGFIRTVSGAVTLTAAESGDMVGVACGASSMDLRVIPDTEWPQFEEFDADEFDLTDHWGGVKRVMHARGGTQEQVAALRCIRFDTDAVVAACHQRISYYTIKGLKAEANVPGEFMETLANQISGPVAARFGERQVGFRSGTTEWISRYVVSSTVDSYPAWRGILRAKSKFDLVVNRAELLTALARTALLPEDSGFRRVILSRKDNELVITATGTDVGTITDVIACSGSYSGDEIRLNGSHVKDLADNAAEDEIRFELEDAVHHLQVDQGPWTAVIMPVSNAR